jgi:uncharacterized membrane protein affecting hemolysin expression
MRKRKIIINKKFQLNLAIRFAGLSALTMAIIIIICSSILINNNLRLEKINVNQQRLSEIQGEILKSLEVLSKSRDLQKYNISTEELQKDYHNTKELYNKNNEKKKKIIHRNNGLVIILIVSSIIQVMLIFLLMLKRSHRISGPIYLMNNYFDEMIKGN